MTKQLRQSITPTHVLGATGTDTADDLGYRALADLKGDMGLNLADLADTWNDAGTTFTAIKMNVTDTASASDSLLMDLQVGGTSKFGVDKDGYAYTTRIIRLGDNTIYWSGIEVSPTPSIRATNVTVATFSRTGNNGKMTLGGGVTLETDAANTLAQRNSTNAQTFNLYNTYTDGSNYERASFTQTATGLVLDAQYLGTGTEPDNILELKSGGSSKFSVSKGGVVNSTTFAGSSAVCTGSIGITNSGTLANRISLSILSGINLSNSYYLGWSSGTTLGTPDLRLYRDTTNTLAQRNSTNAQTFNLYNTYTDGSNYERASFTQTATGLVLDAQYLGTGTEPDNILELKSGGASKFKVEKDGDLTIGGTVFGTTADGMIFGNVSGNQPRIFMDNRSSPGNGSLVVGAGGAVRFATNFGNLINNTSTWGFGLRRDADNTLSQHNFTNAQESRLYGTYTSATNYQRLSTKIIKEAVTAASGASVTTTISIPKYSQLIGVTTRVTTDLGDSNGTTGYTVGDGSDADLWGDITGITAGTTSDAADFTAAAALGPGTADRTITLTATGGNFDGTGVIEVCAFYLRAEAD